MRKEFAVTILLILGTAFITSTLGELNSAQFTYSENEEIISQIISQINETSIENHIQALQDFGTRYSPTENCTLASEYIFNEFNSTGRLSVEYDYFNWSNYQLRNVVATLEGRNTSNNATYIICAHYDSYSYDDPWNDAPGADDNGSGATAVIESAKILSRYEFESTIKFIAFSGEEQGLRGSAHYASQAKENGENIQGVINFDMIAYNAEVEELTVVGNEPSEWLVDFMISVVDDYDIKLTTRKIINESMWYSDHSSFWNNGYDAILGIEHLGPDNYPTYPYIHSSEDTIDKLNMSFAKKIVQAGIATIAKLAGIYLPNLSIELEGGWNLISIPLQIGNSSLPAVLEPINGSYTVVWTYNAFDDDPWKVYNPYGLPWANDFTDVNTTIGMWILMNISNVLIINGSASPLSEIQLREGWNMVGYPSITKRIANSTFSSIESNLTLVWAYLANDSLDPWKVYNPYGLPWANDLTHIIPTYGYWVKIAENDTWVVRA